MVNGWWWHGAMRGPGLLGGLLMFLLFIAFVSLVIWLIVRLARSTPNKTAQSAPQSAPQLPQVDPVLETLRRRLAEGAITVQEFDELRQKLGV